jgi:arginyl-tRNA synthetase
MSLEDILSLIEIPPENIPGDLAFPCFRLSKVLKKSPNEIAKELAQSVVYSDYFSAYSCDGGYFNAHINKTTFIKDFFTNKDSVT